MTIGLNTFLKVFFIILLSASLLPAEDVQNKPEDTNQTKTSEGMPVWLYPLVPLFVAGGVLHAVVDTAVSVPIDAAKWAGGKIKDATTNKNDTDDNKSDNK